ncbi:cytochrome P450 67 [Paraphoma chrysanthemicola]|uniref:Cytochrome P450 67 n=1 Tax=Paraphoma chrysanthemicola TaxID=798071 RepID=A0A8K0QYR0_9PLEO|nr:cytochrome P450 67 [Paraphoma chrysanthemicola]
MDNLIHMAQADTPKLVGAAVMLGISFHLAIQPIEFEFVMFHFMAASVISFLGLFYTFAEVGGYGIAGALTRAVIFAGAFNGSLLLSIAVYRTVFHRCCKFKGPFAAKLSRFYAVNLSAKNTQYYKELAKLHENYGDFVRTGPREISVLRKSAVPLIYGPNSETRKATWYGQTGNDPKKNSIHMTRDYDGHRLRRRAWDRGFSMKALASYEPRIKVKTDIFISQLAKRSGEPMNVSAWAMFFSFDVMGEVGFGKDFNNLGTGVEHQAIQGIHSHMSMLGTMGQIPWLLNVLSCIPGAASGYTEFFSFCAGQIREKHKTWDGEKDPQDIVSWLLKAVKDKEPSASPSAEALEDDSRVVIIAGSETTATTLAGALYFLAKCPEKQQKLQQLLQKAMPGGYNDWSYEAVKSVSYIDDFVNETLRLRPALLTGGARETPPQGMQIDEVFIPGNTNVLVSTHCIQRDPRWWTKAEEFIPERFGEKRVEMGTDDAPYLPFSLGAYSCPGKNLAQMSLRCSLSAIIQNFDVSFAPGETGEKFEHETLDTFTVTLPPLHLNFAPRRNS